MACFNDCCLNTTPTAICRRMLPKDLQLSQREWPSLVHAARGGCDDALTEIIARLEGYLLLIANGQMRENLQAKFGASDIVQNSLLDAHKGIDEFKGSTEAEMRAWLKQIVMHNLADEGRRYTNAQSRNVNRECSLEVVTTPLKTHGSGIRKAIQSESDKQKLAKAVNRLSARQQRVVEGRHRFGYSYQEIAEQLGITEVAARKIWSRALAQLRAFCAEDD